MHLPPPAPIRTTLRRSLARPPADSLTGRTRPLTYPRFRRCAFARPVGGGEWASKELRPPSEVESLSLCKSGDAVEKAIAFCQVGVEIESNQPTSIRTMATFEITISEGEDP